MTEQNLNQEVEVLLKKAINNIVNLEVQVFSNNLNISLISDEFKGMTSVQRQLKIYRAISSLITNGLVHAVNMDLKTTEE